jgi:hypothetical protein
MTRLDQSAIVLTVVGVGAATTGGALLWGVGGALLVLGVLLVLVGFVLGQG